MDHYIFLLRNETIDFASYSPEQIQEIISDFDKWNAGMIRDGRLILSASLRDGTGKTIRPGNIVTDGPYSEAKEAVTGFLVVKANDFEDASAIAEGCPFLPRGGSVEVRMVPKLEFEDVALPIIEQQVHDRTNTKKKDKNGS